MSSIVVNGDTSGSVTLAAPTVAGTVTVTLPATSGTMAVSGGSPSFTALTATNGIKVTGALASVVATSTLLLEQNTASASRILVAGADAGTPPTLSTVLLNNAGGVFGAITQYDSGLSVKSLGINGTTPSSSGAGITFPATQSASTDPNTLDDYEEGTFTPTWNGGSLTLFSCVYTKIGRFVHVMYDVQLGSSASSSSSAISLPFGPSPQQYYSGALNYNSGSATQIVMIEGTSIYIRSTVNGGPVECSVVAGFRLIFSVTYFA